MRARELGIEIGDCQPGPLNALLAAETLAGRGGTVHRLEPDAFAAVMDAS